MTSFEENRLNRLNSWALKIAQWAFILLFFVAPISRIGFYICTGFIILGWLFSGKWNSKWIQLKNNSATLIFLIFIIWIAISMIWTQGSSDTIRMAAKRQWPLIIIPISATISLPLNSLKKCLYSFAAGMLLLLLHMIFMNTIDIPWIKSVEPTQVFYNPLPQSIGLSVFTLWCIYEFLKFKQPIVNKILLFIIILCSLYAVFYVHQQRAAYLTFLFGLVSIIFMQFPIKHSWKLAILITLLLALIVLSNQTIQNRIYIAQQEIIQYSQGSYYNSVGARLHMWSTSIDAIAEKPILGRGIGSYTHVIEDKFQDDRMCKIGCMHPHNQIIFVLFEYGLIGCALFLLSFIVLFFWQGKNKNIFLFSILLVYMISSLTDTTLWYRGYIYLFVPLLAINFIFYKYKITNE